jgi:hypothetical protein
VITIRIPLVPVCSSFSISFHVSTKVGYSSGCKILPFETPFQDESQLRRTNRNVAQTVLIDALRPVHQEQIDILTVQVSETLFETFLDAAMMMPTIKKLWQGTVIANY